MHLKRGLGKAGGHPQIEFVLITIKDDTIYLTHKLAVVNGALCVRLLLFFHVPAANECFWLPRASFPLNTLYNLASLQDTLFCSGTCLSLRFELAMDSFNKH